MKEQNIKRFDIYLYDFGKNEGSIQTGLRPVLVIQDDRMNANSPTTIVAAITTAIKKTYLPSHVIIGPEYGLDNPSMVMMEQLRVVNQTELTRYVGTVTDERMQRRLANAAKKALGFQISTIIDDDNWYDFLKLWAALVRRMGYRGLVVFIDECVNLYKITHRVSRENNYEKILSMFNDTLQGRAPGLALVLGGTPQFMDDQRRGLFSYEALRSRLCDSRFSSEGYKNLVGPVIRLKRLSDDELFALISRITKLYAVNYGIEPRISEAQMVEFLNKSLGRAGADSMITPREMLRDYMTVLHILMQNESASFEDVVGSAVTLKTDKQIEEKREIEQLYAQTSNAPATVNFCPEYIDF